MIKLLLCLLSAAATAVIVLQLRSQHVELEHQNTELHDRIKNQQAKLWNQQLQIAVYTAPNAISQTVGNQHLKMVPQTPLVGQASWIAPHKNPDAE